MTAKTDDEQLGQLVELSPEEGRELFDRQARRYLGMSGEEFARRWADGTIPDPDRTDVLRIAMLLPLFRSCGASGR